MIEEQKKYYEKAHRDLPEVKSEYDFKYLDRITTLMEELGEMDTQTYAVLSTLSLAYYRQYKEKN